MLTRAHGVCVCVFAKRCTVHRVHTSYDNQFIVYNRYTFTVNINLYMAIHINFQYILIDVSTHATHVYVTDSSIYSAKLSQAHRHTQFKVKVFRLNSV